MASRKIGALWKRQTKDGRSYLSGILEDLRGTIQIAVFKNDRKEKENQPDFTILLSEQNQEKKQVQSNDDFGFGESEAIAKPDVDDEEDVIKVENIPFG